MTQQVSDYAIRGHLLTTARSWEVWSSCLMVPTAWVERSQAFLGPCLFPLVLYFSYRSGSALDLSNRTL